MTTAKTALITGASRGIGVEAAVALGRRGYHVVVNYRSDAHAAREVVHRIEQSGGSAVAVCADVTDPEAVTELVDACTRIDALICNPNIQPIFGLLRDLAWEDFSSKVVRELAAAFHVTKASLPLLGAGAQIVYVSSAAATALAAGSSPHASAKAALDALALTVAAEVGSDGIAVNVVAPALTRTDATADRFTPQTEESWHLKSVLHRALEPEDVGGLIATLASGELVGVSGVRILIDGGASLEKLYRN